VLTNVRQKTALILSSLALGASLVAATAEPVAASAQSPIQLGAYVPGAPGDAGTLDSYSSMVGRKPDIVMMFRSLNGPLLYPPEITNLSARNETPLVTLEPYAGSGMADFPDIAAGKYDSYFRKEANALKSVNMTVMLRFSHEMNLPSNDWGPGKAGNTGSSYVDAWRHIVSIFREEGASNVKFVWAPNVDYGGRSFTQYFPGDEWVDYVGLDAYNLGTTEGDPWESFDQLFFSSYTTITQISAKPVIITETSSSEGGGSKAEWIENAFFKTIPLKMPRVQAVVWFDQSKERDWRVDSSQPSLDAYRRVVASSLYGGTEPLTAPKEQAPVVKDLTITPKVTLAPARGAAPANARASRAKPSRGRHGIRVRGRITYKLSRQATVRVALRKRHSDAGPLVFTAEQSAGHKRVPLAKLVGEGNLRRGDYRVSVTAFSSSGTRSQPRHHGFRIAVPR
jgi:hypothetical protein